MKRGYFIGILLLAVSLLATGALVFLEFESVTTGHRIVGDTHVGACGTGVALAGGDYLQSAACLAIQWIALRACSPGQRVSVLGRAGDHRD